MSPVDITSSAVLPPSPPSVSVARLRVTRALLFRLTAFFLAIVYAVALAGLPVGAFLDRANYLVYADQSKVMLSIRISEGVLSLLSNEPVWLLLNSGLALVLSPEWILRLTIFIPAFVVARYAMKVNRRAFFLALLFLLVPQVIKNHIIHLRQGVAVAVFLIAWFNPQWRAKWLLFAITPFIHSAFFFVLGLMLLSGLAKRMRLATDLRVIVYGVASIVIAVSLASLAAAVGARQAIEYKFVATNVSGAGFVFWVALLSIMCLEGKDYIRRHTLEIGSMVFYLGTYFMIEVTARIFESTLLLVLLAGLQLTGLRRQMFLLGVIFYTLLSYYFRLGAPWMGWGNEQ